jgi:hypothetical protein
VSAGGRAAFFKDDAQRLQRPAREVRDTVYIAIRQPDTVFAQGAPDVATAWVLVTAGTLPARTERQMRC